MKMSHAATASSTAAAICAALVTGRMRAAEGGLRLVGPLTRVTSAPAVRLELRDVALAGGIAPHLPVHRRRNQQWAVAGETQRRQQVVGDPVRELGNEVRGRWCDDDHVCLTRELDVAHRILCAGFP